MRNWMLLSVLLFLTACTAAPGPVEVPPVVVEPPVDAPVPVEPEIILPEPVRLTKTFNVEADDKGFYPDVLEAVEGTEVTIIFHIREKNIEHDGLEIKSAHFDTGPVFSDAFATVMFNATKSFNFASYWPDTNVFRAAGRIEVSPPKETLCTAEEKATQACTKEYRPVCGWNDPDKIQCIRYPCAQTYGNKCEACAAETVVSWTPGECPT
jgi:hypothetical protein